MRLINTTTLELQDFSASVIPPYAILSHTWGDDEVSFQDMALASRSSKKGFSKIIQTCQLARKKNLEFAWVDTCCIDKSSSAELTESINSMFQWYEAAVICYVYLVDLPPGSVAAETLSKCRWFTRGWTLQELLAPKSVEFYDMKWNHYGSKLDFAEAISDCTGIRYNVLKGISPPSDCSIATRMSWAARRETSRVEDIGYCLLGLFDVNMPLIYGEGLKAFRRLQEEIVKRNNDLTIFAWDSLSLEQEILSVFAMSPAAFANSSNIVPFSNDYVDFSVTNKGLFISGDMPLRIVKASVENDKAGGTTGSSIERYLILLGNHVTENNTHDFGIYLRKLGPQLFCRDRQFSLANFKGGSGASRKAIGRGIVGSNFYILINALRAVTPEGIYASRFRHSTLHVPLNIDDRLMLKDTVPENLWDVADRVFLRPTPHSWDRYPMVLAMEFHATLDGTVSSVVVLCRYEHPSRLPVCTVYRAQDFRNETAFIFRGRFRKESIYWADMQIQCPSLLKMTNSVNIRGAKNTFKIEVRVVKEIVESIIKNAEVFSLVLNVT